MKWIYAALIAVMTCMGLVQSASAVVIRENLDVLDTDLSNSYTSSLMYDTDTDTGQYSFDGEIFEDSFSGSFSGNYPPLF